MFSPYSEILRHKMECDHHQKFCSSYFNYLNSNPISQTHEESDVWKTRLAPRHVQVVAPSSEKDDEPQFKHDAIRLRSL